MEINENKISLKGVANLSDPLVLDRAYDLQVTNLECTSSRDTSNNDGTCNRTFILTLSELSEVFISFDKAIIKAKRKGSQSQKLRQVICAMAEKLGKDRETYYQNYMSKLIDQIESKL
jgi:hypothetical protein